MKLRSGLLSAAIVFALAACGGSDGEPATTPSVNDDSSSETIDDAPAADTDASSTDETLSVDETGEDTAESAEDFADDLVDSLEDAQQAAGGGSATVTVGDASWTFAPVLCAFGEEETGQEGAEFVLSSIQDGKQMYFSIDRFGHSVSLDDVRDFENPEVSLSSARGAAEFIVIDGKSFSGEAEFLDDTTESFETVSGSFSGTCP